MSEFFRLSLNGAVFIAVICILRFLFRRQIPRTAFVVLWLAALFRLLCPVRLPFAASIWRLFEDGSAEPAAMQRQIVLTESMQGAAANVSNVYDLLEVIWLFTAVLLLGGVLILYLRGVRERCNAEPVETIGKSVYRCKAIAAPRVCGIFRQRILLPENISEEQIPYILLHEQVHVKRMDNLWKFLSLIAAAIHWFNPAAWVLVVLMGRDLEVSCDEWVIRRLGREQRTGYALSLIAIAERPQRRSPLTSGFSQNPLEERIRCIMTSRKKSMIALFAAIAMILCTTAAFATDAPAKKSEVNKDKKEIEVSCTLQGTELPGEMDQLTASQYETYMKDEIEAMKKQVEAGKLSSENYDKSVQEMENNLEGLKDGSLQVYKTKNDKVYKTKDDSGIVTISNSQSAETDVDYQLKEGAVEAIFEDEK